MTPTRLQQIVDSHRIAADRDERSLSELMDQALHADQPRGFRHAVSGDTLSVIAEIKRKSPSAGDLQPDLDPTFVARSYAEGGAACLSVLTDEVFFGGSVADFRAARNAVEIPVLRKDFTVDERDVADARIMGADAILLIVAALDVKLLKVLAQRAIELSLDVLWEIHDERELEIAMGCDATMIGVNQRNLHSFEIDYSLAADIRKELPHDVVTVAESGVRNADDARHLAQIGYNAVLVGTSLVTSNDPGDAVRLLIEGSR